jgi:hypothetical protein
LLTDPEPEVRAAAVYALGTFISNVSEKSDHATSIDLGVGMQLVHVAQDGSPLVRKVCSMPIFLYFSFISFLKEFIYKMRMPEIFITPFYT